MEASERPILDLLTGFNAAAIEASSLDLDVQVLVRVAALVAIDAPPASYLVNLEAGDQVGVTVEQVQGVLCTIAPIVGTARVVSAGGKMIRALGLELELADLEQGE